MWTAERRKSAIRVADNYRVVAELERMVPSKGALCMTLPQLLREDDVPPGTESWKVKI
jgi:hypothetical protein